MSEVEVKDVEYLVVHCSATKASQDVKEEEIRRWHLNRGWTDIGYHVVIDRDGTREYGRALDVRGAHVSGYNSISLGICMVGGLDRHGEPEDNFTETQYKSLLTTLDALHLLFPEAKVCGHRDFPGVTKACPCFEVEDWLKSVYRGHYYGKP